MLRPYESRSSSARRRGVADLVVDPLPDQPVIDVVEGGPFHMLDVPPKFPTMHPLAVVEPLMLSPRACRAIIPAADRADGASLSNASLYNEWTNIGRSCPNDGNVPIEPGFQGQLARRTRLFAAVPMWTVPSMDLRGVYDQSV